MKQDTNATNHRQKAGASPVFNNPLVHNAAMANV
jgi:hypothetical protein